MKIELSKINPAAIQNTNIRTVNKGSKEDEKQLVKALEKGQIYPILIRELTDEEKKAAATDAIYGILDGHRRYEAYCKLAEQNEKFKTINSEIFVCEDEKKIAVIANSARKQLEELEKAEAVYEMHQQEGKSYQAIGTELGFSKSYAGKLGKMWEMHLQNNVENETNKVEKRQYSLSMTEGLAKEVLKEMKLFSSSSETKEKIALKLNLQELITHLQSKLSEINQEKDVREYVIKERTEKIQEARKRKLAEQQTVTSTRPQDSANPSTATLRIV